MTVWRCPRCDRRLLAPRVAHIGCCGILMAIGDCPMHHIVVPRLPAGELSAALARGPHTVEVERA